LRASNVADTVLPTLERRPPRVADSVDLYRLLASQGKPFLRLPTADAAAQVLRAVAKGNVKDEEISAVIGRAAENTDRVGVHGGRQVHRPRARPD
jgi:hypothetical protein